MPLAFGFNRPQASPCVFRPGWSQKFGWSEAELHRLQSLGFMHGRYICLFFQDGEAKYRGAVGRIWRAKLTHDGISQDGATLAVFAKQSIIDRNGKLYGHELLFRDQHGTVATITDDVQCTVSVVEAAIGHVGLHQVASAGSFFLNCSAAFLLSPVVEALPPHRFVLEILETCELNNEMIRRCEQLKGTGYRIALDDVRDLTPQIQNILPLIDIVKIDWPFVEATKRDRLVDTVIRCGKTALAEKIETIADRDDALTSGCELMQGFYFSRPLMVAKKKLQPDFDVVARVMQALLRSESFAEVSKLMERSPSLCLQLLRLANSCAVCHPSQLKISSISQALALAGTQMAITWCALQLYGCSTGTASDPLSDLALQRACQIGYVLTRVGATVEEQNKGRLVGLLSLLHVGHGVTPAELWRSVPLDSDIKRGLVLQQGI
ncbi:EAL and HDOD domain-containing protein, partial [Burkholderia gladioli]